MTWVHALPSTPPRIMINCVPFSKHGSNSIGAFPGLPFISSPHIFFAQLSSRICPYKRPRHPMDHFPLKSRRLPLHSSSESVILLSIHTLLGSLNAMRSATTSSSVLFVFNTLYWMSELTKILYQKDAGNCTTYSIVTKKCTALIFICLSQTLQFDPVFLYAYI